MLVLHLYPSVGLWVCFSHSEMRIHVKQIYLKVFPRKKVKTVGLRRKESQTRVQYHVQQRVTLLQPHREAGESVGASSESSPLKQESWGTYTPVPVSHWLRVAPGGQRCPGPSCSKNKQSRQALGGRTTLDNRHRSWLLGVKEPKMAKGTKEIGKPGTIC